MTQLPIACVYGCYCWGRLPSRHKLVTMVTDYSRTMTTMALIASRRNGPLLLVDEQEVHMARTAFDRISQAIRKKDGVCLYPPIYYYSWCLTAFVKQKIAPLDAPRDIESFFCVESFEYFRCSWDDVQQDLWLHNPYPCTRSTDVLWVCNPDRLGFRSQIYRNEPSWSS